MAGNSSLKLTNAYINIPCDIFVCCYIIFLVMMTRICNPKICVFLAILEQTQQSKEELRSRFLPTRQV